jgi:hypothetical protein
MARAIHFPSFDARLGFSCELDDRGHIVMEPFTCCSKT